MISIKKATILVTNICNINCSHCFWGNTSKKYVINRKLLHNILNVCKENQIQHICFSGGEPFLFLKNILLELNCFSNSFSKISICTNGFWGKEAKNICELLKKSGISTIEISYDIYHAQFISFDTIRNIIIEAPKFDLDIQFIVSIANKIQQIKIYELLNQYVDSKKIEFQYVGPYGRGKEITTNLQYHKNIRCNQFQTHLCIDFNGMLYYCCGPYIVLGRHSSFCIGKFNQKNINKIKNDFELFHYMNSKYGECLYLCEECKKRLDRYLFKRMYECNNIKEVKL